jgi:hypothetical protein
VHRIRCPADEDGAFGGPTAASGSRFDDDDDDRLCGQQEPIL